MGVVISACAVTKTKVVENVLGETPRGAVFLQHAEDGWFRTAHPFDVSADVLATVFRGVHVQESPTETLRQDRVFSEEDAEFLSPLMSTALSKATKHQVVGFRVVQERDGSQETTGGILYVQGRLLHLTLTHYRARPDGSEPGGVASRRSPNPTGVSPRQLAFTPEVVRRTSRHEQPEVLDVPPLASLVLDYDALLEGAALPPTSARSRPIRQEKATIFQQIVDPAFPISGASASHNRQTTSEDASRTPQAPGSEKKGELEALKEEVRRLQRRLSELEGNTPRVKEP